MTRLTLFLAVLLAGCVRPVPDTHVVPKPESLTVEQAADEFVRLYAEGLSVAAADVASTAGSYRDMTALNDAWVEKSRRARENASQVLVDAMNRAVVDHEKRSAADAGPMFLEMSRGFKRRAEK